MFVSTIEADPATARGVLDAASAHRRAADRAEADLLATALTWADMHPAESIDDAAVLIGSGETAVAIAGPGAPLVAEFCVAELAAALGLRTEHGRDLLGETLELAHRLPRLWSRVQAGELQAWRARRTARATMTLSREAAAHVDRHLAPYAHKVGLPTVDRLVAEAVARFMPDLAERRRRDAADRRAVEIDTRTLTFEGTCRMYGELDLADALDLDAALAGGADGLAAAGASDTQQVLRSVALGDLARGECPLPLPPVVEQRAPASDVETRAASDPEGRTADDPRSTCGGDRVSTDAPLLALGHCSTNGAHGPEVQPVEAPTRTAATLPPIVEARRVVLHVHLTDAALASGAGTCRVEGAAGQGGRHLVTVEQVREWCRAAGTMAVHPVLDLAGRIHVECYEIPDRLHNQVTERDPLCVFPWCTRASSSCDVDHVDPYDRGGPTASDNLAPLCRHHHRIKTHDRWRYDVVEPATYLWHSPHGAAYVVEPTGTRAT